MSCLHGHRRSRRRARQQAAQRRRGVGAPELGPRACDGWASTSGSSSRSTPPRCVDAAGGTARVRVLREPPLLRGGRRASSGSRTARRSCTRTGASAAGCRWTALTQVAAEADLLVNISGHLRLEPLMRRLRRKAYVDIDPGFTQFWHADRHSAPPRRATTRTSPSARTSARRDCPIPTGGIDWQPVRQPVVLDDWPVAADGDLRPASPPSRTWRGAFGADRARRPHVRAEGARVPQVHRAAANGAARLRDRARHPPRRRRGPRRPARRTAGSSSTRGPSAGDPDAFRTYVQALRRRVLGRPGRSTSTPDSGWFSDRTVRYLASGRPALVQDTGFSRTYPVGEGLLAFRTLDEAAAGAQRIAADYEAHREAARSLAEERFDSDKVLPRFLAQAGVSQ